MTDRETFTRAICADPDDDTTRLVFADWLEEHGEPERAEFIRVQIEHAHGNPGRSYGELTPRERQLLDLHLARWFADPEVTGIGRGFGFHIELPCDAFMQRAEALFATHPVTSVQLTDQEPLNCSDDGEPPRYIWVRAWREDRRFTSWEIPFYVWGPELETIFDTEDAAHEAASRCCVTFGRRRAGLPAWQPHTPTETPSCSS